MKPAPVWWYYAQVALWTGVAAFLLTARDLSTDWWFGVFVIAWIIVAFAYFIGYCVGQMPEIERRERVAGEFDRSMKHRQEPTL